MFLTRLKQTLFRMLIVSFMFARFGSVSRGSTPAILKRVKEKNDGYLPKQEVRQVPHLKQACSVWTLHHACPSPSLRLCFAPTISRTSPFLIESPPLTTPAAPSQPCLNVRFLPKWQPRTVLWQEQWCYLSPLR